MKNYKYKAFISYRHLEPDMQAAEKLQKLLEGYKPPKNLSENKEHWRIFRDVSELQSSSDLSEDIRNAIEDSDFLIVICSPAYNESKWCMQELTRFRELHGDTNENIITLLVAGEPDKAFPELLRYTDMKTVDENGVENTVKVEVEPLAANIKADTLKASMKKLNTEYLRIAAPLIGCDFNDLYQREKKREAQRRMRLFGAAFAVLSVITVISAASAVAISKRNKEIKDKNDTIEQQYGKIQEQYEKIQEQYDDLLVENAGHLAAESEVLFKNNELIPAIRKSVEALPSEEGEKPVIPEAEYALSRELGAFEAYQTVPRYALRHEAAIEQLSYMGGGKSVVSQDATGVYFWKAEDGSLIRKLSPSDSEFASEKYGTSNKLTAIIKADTDKTGTVLSFAGIPQNKRYLTGNIFDAIYIGYQHNVTDEEKGTGGDVYLSNSDGTVWRLNGENGDIVWKAPVQEEAYSCIQVKYDGSHILRLWKNKHMMSENNYIAGTDTYIDIIDCETGKIADYAKISELADNSYTFLASVNVLTYNDGVLSVFVSASIGIGSDGVIASYKIEDHKLVQADKYEIPDRASVSSRKVFVRNTGRGLVTVVSDCVFSGSISSVSRFEGSLSEPEWTVELSGGPTGKCEMYTFKGSELGCDYDVLAVVYEEGFSIINYETGSVIRNVALDSEIADVSFSDRGLIMFTVKSGAEYAVSVKGYVSEKPVNNAYRVQTFNSSLDLCSYSLNRYVTAAEYSSTAYIQFSDKTSAFIPLDIGEDNYCTELVSSDDGGCVLICSRDYSGGSSDGTGRFFIYNIGTDKLIEITDLKGSNVAATAYFGEKFAAAVTDGSGAKKIVLIGAPDGKVTAVADTGDFNSAVRLITDGSSMYYRANSSSDVLRITPDGGRTSWKKDGKLNEDGIFCPVGEKLAVYAYYNTDKTHKLEFYSFDTGETVTADHNFDAADGVEIAHIFSIDDNTCGVLLSSRVVLIFDTATGRLTSEIKLSGISQEPVSAEGIEGGKFAVLCRDSVLYEADANGLTGRKISLEFADSYNGKKISEADASNDSYFEVKASPEDGQLYIVWGGSHAWLIDTEQFKLRYRIGSFASASRGNSIVFTFDRFNGKGGYFPVYSAQQLREAAEEYLSDLGETPEADK
ncbi:MAG: TIR domain-containing protein [Ruminococcus sp.]|nr:TIR domain-containing protein [Ruminococcus sp.]